MKRIFFNIVIPLVVIVGLFFTISTLNFENWVVDRSVDIQNYEAKQKDEVKEDESTKKTEKKTLRESLRERIKESEDSKRNDKENNTS